MTEDHKPAPEAGTTPESVLTNPPAADAAADEGAHDTTPAGEAGTDAIPADTPDALSDSPAETVETPDPAAAEAQAADALDAELAPVARPATRKAAAKKPDPATGERIAKVIARVGLASRRVAEKMILDGRVKVNGKVIDSPALDIGPGDKVVVDGKPLDAPQDTRLWLYYKPAGLVTTESDELGRRTIYDELPGDLPRVMTVGRLDLNSEGLLLLTNDGELKRRLELPATGWLRRYKVRVNGRPTNLTFDPLRRGVTIGGEEFAPMEITLDSQRGDNAWLTIGIREGRNREIRRAMEHVGLIVNRLIRLSYGPFRLTTMKEGEVAEVRRRILRDQLGPLLPGNEAAEADSRPARGRRPGPGPRPARGAEGDRPARKPFGPRAEGAGERPKKPFGRRPDGEGFSGEGARKPFGRRPDGDAPRKPHAARDGEGPRKPYAPRDGDAPRKSYAPRDGEGDRKPYGRRQDGEGTRKPYAPRDGDAPRKSYAPRDGEGDRKPYGRRQDGDGPRKAHAARDGEGARKPYAPRDSEGGKKPYGRRAEGDAPRKPYAARDGEGVRKPYAPRPETDGEAPRKPRHKAGAPRGEGFAARPPRDDSTPRKPYAPRGEGEGFKPRGPRREGESGGKGFAPRTPREGGEGKPGGFKPRGDGQGFKPRGEGSEGFKPRGEGKPGGFKPRAGGPGKPGGFKPRGDRPTGGRPGPRKGPSRQG